MKSTFTLPARDSIERTPLREGFIYSLHNYYGHGPIAHAKRRRFQIALDLGSELRGQRVIDMGSADGVFIHTLARECQSVVAIDHNPAYAKFCEQLIEALKIPNARAMCNGDISIDALRERIGSDFGAMFLLETLEHVGTQPDMWGSKIRFLKDCFSLLKPGAPIIISVPKMVGPIVVFKNLLQRALRIGHDKLTIRQLLRSGFLYQTDDLEPLWTGCHVGFNHMKLERHMAEHFKIVRRKSTAISVFYVLKNKP